MRSSVILGVSAALVVLALVAGIILFNSSKPKTSEGSIPTSVEAGATIILTTKKGVTISVPDFTYNKPRVEIEGFPVTYVYITQSPDGMELDSMYGIVFGSDSTFTVALFAEPLSTARMRAEEKLRELLPAPPAILCDLPVKVAVPDTISPMYAQKDLGLSFCPGATTLP